MKRILLKIVKFKETVGLNFAFENEAKKFFNILTNFNKLNFLENINGPVISNTSALTEAKNYLKQTSESVKKAEKRFIRKADIGKAISATFVHINHIGVSSEKNSFNVSYFTLFLLKISYLNNIYKQKNCFNIKFFNSFQKKLFENCRYSTKYCYLTTNK